MLNKNSSFEDKVKYVFEKTKSSLTENDMIIINNLIKHGESGIAYDIICDQLYEHNAPISKDIYDQIIEIGLMMGYKEDKLLSLKKLII